MNDKYEVKRTQTIVLIGIATALITTVTMFIQIPKGQGYLNLGDFAIMMMSTLLPFTGGVFAAGVGSALADIATGHAVFAIFTLFIKAGEVVIIHLLRDYLDTPKRFIPFSLAALWMMIMYGFVNVLLGGGNWWLFLSALQGDVFQGIVAAGLATLAYPRFKKVSMEIRGK